MIAWVVAAGVLAAPITLDEVRAASRENLNAVQAQLDVVRAEEGIRASRSAILPQLQGQAQAGVTLAGPQRLYTTVPVISSAGEISYTQQSVELPAANHGNFLLGLSLNQLIYDGGRWWNQLALSGAQAEAARGQLEEQRLASQFEAERRFFELLRAQQVIQVLQQTVDRSQTQVERARALYEAGRGQKRDTLDAEVNLGNDQISVVRAQQSIVGAQADLLEWLARPSSEIEAVTPGSLQGPPGRGPPPAKALELAQANRPLLKAFASQKEAARLALEVAHAAWFPRVGGSISYSRQAPTADPFFTDPSRQNALTLGLSLNWDIFSGFATEAAIARASADARTTDVQSSQAQLELGSEIRRTCAALDTQLKIATLAEKNREVAQTSLKLSEERFNAGAGSTLEVRDAEIKLTQAQLTQVQGRIDVEIARAALARIIGAQLP